MPPRSARYTRGEFLITVLLRTLLIYLLLLAAMRLVGKRQIGELQISELITTLMLSDLAVLPISDIDIPISYAVLPIATLLSLEVFISYAAARWPDVRKLFYGAPSVLIFQGCLNAKELSRLRIGIGELLSELRLKDVADIREVHCAILEDNGKLSVFKHADFSPLTPRDAGTPVSENGVSLPLIVSGRLMPDSMRCAGVDTAWVRNALRRKRLKRRDVLLMSVNEQREILYILKHSPGTALREEEIV